MKDTLKAGLTYQHRFTLTKAKMVPALYPESDEFPVMPEVFATGYLVGLLEWACIKALNPHLDWPREQSVGTHINVSHSAATPAGFEVVTNVQVVAIDGKRVTFNVEAHDGIDLISKGTHERFVIDKVKFDTRVAAKFTAKLAANTP